MAITFNPLTRSLDNTVEGQTNLGTNTNFGDDVKLTFGVGNDLQLYHSGTASFIQNTTASTLLLQNEANIQFEAKSGEDSCKMIPHGQIELYYDAVKKLETASYGTFTSGTVACSGDLDIANDTGKVKLGASAHLQIYHSTNSYIDSIDGDVYVRVNSTENAIKCTQNGNVELSFDGTKKFETISDGCTVSQNLNVGSELNLTGGSDGDRFIDAQVGTGALNIRKITGGDLGHETMAKFFGDAGCELYHNAVKKFETTGSGITVQGSVTTQDMNMSNLNGSANEVDNTKGSWSLQEGADDLFLINRVNGKKYKFNITEIN